MLKNDILNNARLNRKDEFYTRLSDIVFELDHYTDKFTNKVIYCNCDNPIYSNFWKYFYDSFDKFKLKGLIATYFIQDGESIKWEMYQKDNIIKTRIKDGDFRSCESVRILERADLVITNPPFSLFREYIGQLFEYNKKFIIFGNMNMLVYKDVFLRILNNELWFGYTFNKNCYFQIPYNYDQFDEAYTLSQNDGYKYAKLPAITIFTNVDVNKRHESLSLQQSYNADKYMKYDNLDAINVDRVKDIPFDYTGVMGVPITFLGKYNPSEFELIGIASGNAWANYKEILTSLNFDPTQRYGGGLGIGIVNGQPKYARILIKHRFKSV